MTGPTQTELPLAMRRSRVLSLCLGALSVLPPFTFGRLSTRLLRGAGLSMGKTSAFWSMPTFSGPLCPSRALTLGESVGLNAGCHFELFDKVTLEDDVSIGHDVLFLTRHRDPETAHDEARPVTIKRGAWIGARATILPGVTVGEGAVIGAQVVVREDVPAHVMFTGNRKLSIAKWR